MYETQEIILSVAIPTRNRRLLLQELIESILPQLSSSIQVVLSDNASDDDTSSYCANLLSEHSDQNFKFIQNVVNIGMEKNVLKAVSECNGKYVWLMGDDDKIKPGAFDTLLSILAAKDYATGIVNFDEFDYHFEHKLYNNAFNLAQDNLDATLEDLLKTVSLAVAFLSCHIVRRSLWIGSDLSRFEGQPTDSVHIYIPIIAGKQGTNFILAKPILSRRNSRYNWDDIFTANIIQGWFEAMEEAVKAGVSRNTVDKFYKILIYHLHLSRDVLHKKINKYARLKEESAIFSRQYGRFPGYWLFVAPLFLAPRSLLCLMLTVFRTVKRMIRPWYWLPIGGEKEDVCSAGKI